MLGLLWISTNSLMITHSYWAPGTVDPSNEGQSRESRLHKSDGVDTLTIHLRPLGNTSTVSALPSPPCAFSLLPLIILLDICLPVPVPPQTLAYGRHKHNDLFPKTRVCPSFPVHLSTLIPVVFLGGKYGHDFTQLRHTPWPLPLLPIPKHSIQSLSQSSFPKAHTMSQAHRLQPTTPTQHALHLSACMLSSALPTYPTAKPHSTSVFSKEFFLNIGLRAITATPNIPKLSSFLPL